MCGLTGVLSANNIPTTSVLSAMTNAIHHRGPDDQGVWIDSTAGIGLAHARLAIVDLSPAGHQPMGFLSGRFVIAFNGEIYNHLELRTELEKNNPRINWKGHSDTETLLAGFDYWGIRETIKRSVGMFAIAVWDKEENNLTLIRDRLGEKPLYYGWQEDIFFFGSELKALTAHPSFNCSINRDAIALFLRHSYIPAPHSIYQNIYKLMPGSLATISIANPTPTIEYYWSASQVAKDGISNPLPEDEKANINALEKTLLGAIKLQMAADVPLGAFLSGGIDSSTVVALMQAQSARPIKTFSIGFHEKQYNEAHYAKAVADHLGTEHTEFYATPEDALEVIPKLAELYDEPFADVSQIPTYLVSKLARQHVTVSLSGDAGDELFCGYNRYLLTNRIWRYLGKMPLWTRNIISSCILFLSPSTIDAVAEPIFRLLPKKYKSLSNQLGDKLHKSANVIKAKDGADLYRRFISLIQDPENYVIGSSESATTPPGINNELQSNNDLEQMMLTDILGYLPNDILTKVDRAAMGVSLETRVPFLDHRVVEFAWRIPMKHKIHNSEGKWILKQILFKYVPKDLIERPKMGFGVPIDSWLRGPLRGWAAALLSTERLKREGFLQSTEVQKLWQEHLLGYRNWQYQLWNILMFQLWLEKHNREK